MSVMNGGGDGSDDSEEPFEDMAESELVEDGVDIVRDYLDDAVGSAALDAFVGGFAVGLFITLPEGVRGVALLFAALAGVELSDAHARRKVPVDILREGYHGGAGVALGAAAGAGARYFALV